MIRSSVGSSVYSMSDPGDDYGNDARSAASSRLDESEPDDDDDGACVTEAYVASLLIVKVKDCKMCGVRSSYDESMMSMCVYVATVCMHVRVSMCVCVCVCMFV